MRARACSHTRTGKMSQYISVSVARARFVGKLNTARTHRRAHATRLFLSSSHCEICISGSIALPAKIHTIWECPCRKCVFQSAYVMIISLARFVTDFRVDREMRAREITAKTSGCATFMWVWLESESTDDLQFRGFYMDSWCVIHVSKIDQKCCLLYDLYITIQIVLFQRNALSI